MGRSVDTGHPIKHPRVSKLGFRVLQTLYPHSLDYHVGTSHVYARQTRARGRTKAIERRETTKERIADSQHVWDLCV